MRCEGMRYQAPASDTPVRRYSDTARAAARAARQRSIRTARYQLNATTAAPSAISKNRWFALATIAQNMIALIATATARSQMFFVFTQTPAEASAIQPKWKLGMAAYSFRMSEG